MNQQIQQPPYPQVPNMMQHPPPALPGTLNAMGSLKPLMMVPLQPTGFLKEQKELDEEEKKLDLQICESENNLKQQYQVSVVLLLVLFL